MNDNYCIYVHTNKTNGKRYVGQTKDNPEIRWGTNGRGYTKQRFYEAIQEFGWDNFDHTILETGLNSVQADIREKYWISYFNSQEPNGYNIDPGGNGKSPETRARMSIAQKNRWDTMDPETRMYMTNQLRQHRIDVSGSNNPMYGTHRTGKQAARRRAVQCIETGQIFPTVKEASQWCNNGKDSLKSHIAAQIKGERKSCGKHPQTGQKLHWRYINED